MARKELGFSQMQIAQKIGSGQGDVSKIEKGDLIGRHLFSYLRFLKENGIDLNNLF